MRARTAFHRRLVGVAAGLAVLTAGCGTVRSGIAPTCIPKNADTLVLMAQSVPTATKIPCIASYPAGWHSASMDIRSGRSEFVLDSDRAGISALRVNLQRQCDVTGATEIPSDEPETQRFERILRVVNGFRAVRTYRFAGGCVTYRFNFRERGQALVNEVSVAVGFTTRARLDEHVRERSGGDLRL